MRALSRIAACIAGLVVSAAAAAHEPASTSLAWRIEPWVAWPLGLTGAAFAVGRWHLATRAAHGAPPARTLLFWSGWGVLAGALLSPLHAAGARSFAAHMLEHELLMLVAAPLLVLSRPGGVLLWGLPRGLRLATAALARPGPLRAAWRALTEPVAATALQLLVLFAWHAPAAFGRALASEGWHIAQHASFFIAALLFWSAMFGRAAHARMPTVVGCLFVTSVVGGGLGAFMALSSSPWYAAYRAMQLSAFGLTPAQDQQLAGLLMWIPGGALHAVAGLWLLARRLRDTQAVATEPSR